MSAAPGKTPAGRPRVVPGLRLPTYLAAGVLQAPFWRFAVTAVAHVLIVLQALWRISRRPPVPREEKSDFVPIGSARSATPESVAMSAPEDEQPDADQPR